MAESSLPQLVLASHNKGKILEFRSVLGLQWRICPQDEWGITEVPETGSTFVENALIKARHASEHTGCAALADDSGLVVPALGGDPGLRSARYSGEGDEANNELLLENMAALEGTARRAFYIAVVVFLQHDRDPTPLIAEGRWYGHIAQTPRGSGGFGYDPLFIPAGGNQYAAEMPPEDKNRVSHRAIAVARLLDQLGE
jgi:XTP/dITP diphosphohydrolase